MVTVATLVSGVNVAKLASADEVVREMLNVSSSSINVSSKAKTVVHCRVPTMSPLEKLSDIGKGPTKSLVSTNTERCKF